MRIKFPAEAVTGEIIGEVIEQLLDFTEDNKLEVTSATLYANIKTRSLKPVKVVVKENGNEIEWFAKKNEFTRAEEEDCQLIAELTDDEDEIIGYLYKREIK